MTDQALPKSDYRNFFMNRLIIVTGALLHVVFAYFLATLLDYISDAVVGTLTQSIPFNKLPGMLILFRQGTQNFAAMYALTLCPIVFLLPLLTKTLGIESKLAALFGYFFLILLLLGIYTFVHTMPIIEAHFFHYVSH